MQPISFRPIAFVHNPAVNAEVNSHGEAVIEFFPEFVGDMIHLEPLSHISIIYNQPSTDNWEAPQNNEPALSIACIRQADPVRIVIDNTDIPDQARILNIKPFVPHFDVF